jgi:hypothetical protein
MAWPCRKIPYPRDVATATPIPFTWHVCASPGDTVRGAAEGRVQGPNNLGKDTAGEGQCQQYDFVHGEHW